MSLPSLYEVTRIWSLTQLEVEVLDYMLRGYANSEIAACIGRNSWEAEIVMDGIFLAMKVRRWKSLVMKLHEESRRLKRERIAS